MSDRITVVSGLIHNNSGEILMALRHPEQIQGNVWEIPGGKVEKGETEREALKREMYEELGVNVEIHELISVASFNLECRINMLLYACLVHPTHEMKPLESQMLRWQTPLYARQQLPCLPSLFTWFPDIIEHLRRQQSQRRPSPRIEFE